MTSVLVIRLWKVTDVRPVLDDPWLNCGSAGGIKSHLLLLQRGLLFNISHYPPRIKSNKRVGSSMAQFSADVAIRGSADTDTWMH